MDLKRMDELILSWQDEIFEKLKRWIAIESVGTERTADNAPFGDNVRRALDMFLSDAGEMGFETLDVDGYAGHAQYGHGPETLGILAHLDIVPLGAGWTQDPLGGEIVDGKCYGRGVIDDKGPLLGALYALRAVKEAAVPLKHGVRIIAGCDEETGMSDMRYYASKVKMPDYGFSPDAEFPLINIEKGGLTLRISGRMKSDAGAGIEVCELFAGERVNVVPGTAFAVVRWHAPEPLQAALDSVCRAHAGFALKAEPLDADRARITATGVGAHAAMPEQGVNAAGMLLTALKELGAPEPIGALAGLIDMEFDGKSLGIATSDELSGALTCNLGILRCDGRSVEVQLDIRYPICADEQAMCGQVVMALSPHQLALERMGGRAPLHVPEEHRVVRELLNVYREQTGLEPYAMAIGGGTYSRMIPNTVAFGISFPDDPHACHMPDEFVHVDKFMLSIRVMAHAIARLAGDSAEA